jgi:opacity protein-like surface antigen
MLIAIVGLTLAASGQSMAASERTPLADRTPLLYVSVDGGYSLVSDTEVTFFGVASELRNDSGFNVGAEIGSQSSEHFRFGLSLLYSRFTTSTTRVGTSVLPGGQVVDMVRPLWNFYWDFSLMDEFLRPYVGAGLGAAWAGFDSTSLGYGEASDWGLAYVIHAGTHIALTDLWLLKVGYRFNGTGSLWNDQLNFITGNLRSHDFLVGVTMNF